MDKPSVTCRMSAALRLTARMVVDEVSFSCTAMPDGRYEIRDLAPVVEPWKWTTRPVLPTPWIETVEGTPKSWGFVAWWTGLWSRGANG